MPDKIHRISQKLNDTKHLKKTKNITKISGSLDSFRLLLLRVKLIIKMNQ